jgi:hypothetical protein
MTHKVDKVGNAFTVDIIIEHKRDKSKAHGDQFVEVST